MTMITLANGTQLHIRPAQVTMVSGAGQQSQVSGFGPEKLEVQEGAQALLNHLQIAAAFAPFTTPNGVPIWVNRDAVSLVRAPLTIENGQAVVYAGGEKQALAETVAVVRAAVGL